LRKKCVRLMDFNSIKFDSMNRSRFFHSPRAPLFTMLESTCTYHVAKRSRFFVHSRGGLFDGNVIVFLSTRSTLSPHLNIDLGGWRGVGKFSSYCDQREPCSVIRRQRPVVECHALVTNSHLACRRSVNRSAAFLWMDLLVRACVSESWRMFLAQ